MGDEGSDGGRGGVLEGDMELAVLELADRRAPQVAMLLSLVEDEGETVGGVGQLDVPDVDLVSHI